MEATTPVITPEKTESKWITNLKKYLKFNFSLKNNLWRLLWITVGAIVVLIPALTCNLMVRHGSWTATTPVANSGISFGSMDGNTAAIYALQSVICVLIASCIVFNNKWYYVILLSLAFTGGLFNLIDRATSIVNLQVNGITMPSIPYVIDYLPTGTTTSNFPDVFVLTGIIGFGVLYIIMNIMAIVNEKKTTKVEDPVSPPSPTVVQDSEIK